MLLALLVILTLLKFKFPKNELPIEYITIMKNKNKTSIYVIAPKNKKRKSFNNANMTKVSLRSMM